MAATGNEAVRLNQLKSTVTKIKNNIPTKTSDLTNDSGFIDNTVDDLVNYTKTDDLPQELFICTYGVTTYNEIVTAVDTGKLPVCTYQSLYYTYVGAPTIGTVKFLSQNVFNSYNLIVTVDGWECWSDVLEATSNKTQTLSLSSTTSQYPSAKCVYDAIEDIREIAEGKKSTYVISITENPSFNSQENSITLTSPIKTIQGNTVTFDQLSVGDSLYVSETDVPDRWVAQFLNKTAIEDTTGNSTQGTYISPSVAREITSDTYYDENDRPIELRGIGDNTDDYDHTGVITRNIATYTFTGLEVWDNSASSTLAGHRVFRNTSLWNTIMPIIDEECDFYCDRFIPQNSNAYAQANRITRWIGSSITKQGMICISEDDLGITSSATQTEAVTAFQTWLAAHPTTVYFPTKNSTTENMVLYTIGEKTGVVANKLETAKVPITSISVNGTVQEPDNGEVKLTVPTKTTDILNDSGYIDNTVANLANYTKTTDLATVATTGSYTDLVNKKLVSLSDNGTTTAGTWLAKSSEITSYVDGQLYLYKITVAGASTTTLNINGIGAKTVYRFAGNKLTTHYAVGHYLMLYYDASLNSGCFVLLNDYGDGDTAPASYCYSAGNVAAKMATHTGYKLLDNSYDLLTVVNSNTVAGKLTLNINSQGAKTIYINDAISSSSNYTMPAGTYVMYYNGTSYYIRTDGKIPCGDTVVATNKYIAARGENLLTNGTCLLGNNYNFSTLTFDGSDTYYAGGCFKRDNMGGYATYNNDELIPVDVNKKYVFDFHVKSNHSTTQFNGYMNAYDIDGNSIVTYMTVSKANTLTSLARDLNPGDTVIYLTDASNWKDSSTTSAHERACLFWNYTNSFGYMYETGTYTRYRYDGIWTYGNLDTTAGTITLSKAWTGPAFTAGWPVSQGQEGSGAVYMYHDGTSEITFNAGPADTWNHHYTTVTGTQTIGSFPDGCFPHGTAFVKVGLMRRPYTDPTTGETILDNIKLSSMTFSMNASSTDIPTIGTLSTNNTTAQSVPSSPESFSSAIKLHKISKTGSYADLLNKPTIPTVNDGTLTIQKNGSTIDTFTANSSIDKTIDLTVPTKTSDITNDSNFITNDTAQIEESQVTDLENDLQTIREIAEGKKQTYVVSDVTNPIFNSQANYITTSSFTDINGNVISVNDLEVGDSVYVTELNVPDRWVTSFSGLPSGYQQCEYISWSDGISYTDSSVQFGSIPNYDTIELTYSSTSTSASNVFLGDYPRTGVVYYDSNPTSWKGTSLDNFSVSPSLTIAEYNDGTKRTLTISYTSTKSGAFAIGGYSVSNYSNGKKIYGVKGYKNNVLVLNLVPAYRLSDGNIGLYDVTNSVFYPNTGTTPFSKGADVQVRANAVFYQLETAKVPVTDVQFNSSSVVSDNIATIPYNLSSYNNDLPKELFWCTYGTTTLDEITEAIADNKFPVCYYGNILYYASYFRGTYIYFSGAMVDKVVRLLCVYSGTPTRWDAIGDTIQEKALVTTLSAASDDTHYPSAKCTYNAIQDVREVAEGKKQTYVVSATTNADFAVQADTFTTANAITDINGNNIPFTDLQVGDTFYIQESNYPDRWVMNFLDKTEISDGTIGTGTAGANPSPSELVEPTWSIYYNENNQAQYLRAVGSYHDVYNTDLLTGTITRNIGVLTLTGTESIYDGGSSGYWGISYSYFTNHNFPTATVFSNAWLQGTYTATSGSYCAATGSTYFAFNKASMPDCTTTSQVQSYFATMYANGTPVKIYYPLAVSGTETLKLYVIGERSGVTFSKLETAKVPVVDVQINGSTVVSNNTANIVTQTTLSAESTDDQIPSAKAVYDIIGNVETLLEDLL